MAKHRHIEPAEYFGASDADRAVPSSELTGPPTHALIGHHATATRYDDQQAVDPACEG